MNIKFYNSVLHDLLDVDEFLDEMIKFDLLNEKGNNYGDDVSDLCRNAVTWKMMKLMSTEIFHKCDVKVIEGKFRNNNHCWLQVDDVFVDLTLAQFLDGCPKLSVTDVDEVSHQDLYLAEERYDVTEWLLHEITDSEFTIDF